MADLPTFSSAENADAWTQFTHTLGPADREWMEQLVAYSAKAREPLEVTLARAALERHAVNSDIVEQLGWQQNTINRLASKLRKAGLSAA